MTPIQTIQANQRAVKAAERAVQDARRELAEQLSTALEPVWVRVAIVTVSSQHEVNDGAIHIAVRSDAWDRAAELDRARKTVCDLLGPLPFLHYVHTYQNYVEESFYVNP